MESDSTGVLDFWIRGDGDSSVSSEDITQEGSREFSQCSVNEQACHQIHTLGKKVSMDSDNKSQGTKNIGTIYIKHVGMVPGQVGNEF